MKKVFVSAGIHGNERFGLKVLGQLQNNYQNSIMTFVAHPEAVAKNIRYIESDLNRSFNGGIDTIEERLAVYILQVTERFRPDIVIDIHTSVSECGISAIATRYSIENHRLAEQCGAPCLVILPTPHAFIEQFNTPAIAFEIGKNLRSDHLAKSISKKIQSISQNGIAPTKPSIPVYELRSTIPKTYQHLARVKNLIYDNDLDGYPFLAGPHTYSDMGGFLLTEKQLN